MGGLDGGGASSSHTGRTTLSTAWHIACVVTGRIASARCRARDTRFRFVVGFVAVSTRTLAVNVEVVAGRQRQIVEEAVSASFVAPDCRVVVEVGIGLRI